MLGRNGVTVCSVLVALCWAPAAFARPSATGRTRAPGVRKSSVQWVDPVAGVAPDAAHAERISRIIFVNRCTGGCTFTPGTNDARVNTSSLVSNTAQISEFPFGDDV